MVLLLYHIKHYNIGLLIFYFHWVMIGVRTSFSFISALLLSVSRLSNFLPSSVFLRLNSFFLFPCTNVRENTLAWVTHFLQPYLMVLDFFRQWNFKCAICIRSGKLDILTHYSTPEPLNYLTDGQSFFLCPIYWRYSHLSSYRLRLFLYLISFLQFPCASVQENTRVRVPHSE